MMGTATATIPASMMGFKKLISGGVGKADPLERPGPVADDQKEFVSRNDD